MCGTERRSPLIRDGRSDAGPESRVTTALTPALPISPKRFEMCQTCSLTQGPRPRVSGSRPSQREATPHAMARWHRFQDARRCETDSKVDRHTSIGVRRRARVLKQSSHRSVGSRARSAVRTTLRGWRQTTRCLNVTQVNSSGGQAACLGRLARERGYRCRAAIAYPSSS